jgi:hypothetical protein
VIWGFFTNYDGMAKVCEMKRCSIVVAGLAGAGLGFLSTVYVGMAMGLATSLTTTATVVLLIICPVIYSIWLKWWLVPILNGLLYGGVAFAIAKWRSGRLGRVGH